MAWEADILKVKGENESEIDITQSFLTVCDSMDCSPQGPSAHWVLQARILGWVVVLFSKGSS